MAEAEDSSSIRHPVDSRRSETLDYLQPMLEQMRVMAEREGFDMLAYLIAMAGLEATEMMRGQKPS